MNKTEHNMFVIAERIKKMSVEFDALKAAVTKLITDYNALKVQVANPPAPDPAPADVAALTASITSVIGS